MSTDDLEIGDLLRALDDDVAIFSLGYSMIADDSSLREGDIVVYMGLEPGFTDAYSIIVHRDVLVSIHNEDVGDFRRFKRISSL